VTEVDKNEINLVGSIFEKYQMGKIIGKGSYAVVRLATLK